MSRFAWVASFLMASARLAFASATQDNVALYVHDPMSPAGKGTVKFSIAHSSSQSVSLTLSAPWRIERDGKVIFQDGGPYPKTILLAPKQSHSWEWNKRDLAGQFAPSGNYALVTSYGTSSGVAATHGRDFALMKGAAAGLRRFPLRVGNEWTFVVPVQPGWPKAEERVISVISEDKGWYLLRNLTKKDVWLKTTGAVKPLLVTSVLGMEVTLVRFEESIGTEWKTPIGKFRVGATKDEVKNPAGIFSGSYRVDESKDGGGVGSSTWYALDVGPVGLNFEKNGKLVWGRFMSAKVRGDGMLYRIGVKAK